MTLDEGNQPRELHPMAVAIKERRQELNLTREQLSQRTQEAISPSMVSYYERSTNPMAPPIVRLLAKALEWPTRELEQYANVPAKAPQKARAKPYIAMAFRQRESSESFAALMRGRPYVRNLMRTPDDEQFVSPDVQLAWEFWEHSRAKYEYASLNKKGRH